MVWCAESSSLFVQCGNEAAGLLISPLAIIIVQLCLSGHIANVTWLHLSHDHTYKVCASGVFLMKSGNETVCHSHACFLSTL